MFDLLRALIPGGCVGLFKRTANSFGHVSRTVSFLAAGLCLLSLAAPAALAAPTLTVGSVSGQAGSAVSFPIDFNPGGGSVAGLEFIVTLPPSITTMSITAGAMIASQSKLLSSSLSGSTWHFIIFGFTQDTLPAGTLLTAQVQIAAGASGALAVPISGTIYSDALGATIAPGTSTGGTITVGTTPPPAPVITSGASATGTVGSAFIYQITASNSPASFNATGLPNGVSVNTTSGLISGTPTAAATSNVTISATNAGGTGSRALSLIVSAVIPPAPVITSTGTFSAVRGAAFSYQIAATNNPSSFNATGLPAGLTVSTASGLISGTPTAAGTSNVTLSAINAGGTGTKALTLIVTVTVPPAPVITSAGAVSVIRGTALSYQIAASNSPTSFNATGLPTGVTVNTTTGLISGTPTAAGTFNITLSATNGGGTGTRALALTVAVPAVSGPALDGGSASAQAGTFADLRIAFDPGSTSIANIQFNLTLPVGMSTESVVLGGTVTSAQKQLYTGVSGNVWSFVIFGINQNTIAAGTLLTARIRIASTVASGPHNISVSGAIYSDPDGIVVVPGGATNGSITISGVSGLLTAPGLNFHDGDFIPVNASISASYTGSVPAPYYAWSLTPVNPSLGSKFRTAGAAALLPSASMTTSSPQANLGSVVLGLGEYIISVRVSDGSNNFSAETQARVTLVAADLSGVRAYPNPWRADRHNVPLVTFDHLTVGSKVKIFSVSGHFVRSLPTSNDSVTWDLNTDSGDKVASGIYLYTITTDQGQKKTGQVVLIR